MDERDDDQLYWQACDFVVRGGSPRTSHLMIRFRVGYKQASRWIERMMENGIITPPKDRIH